MKRIVFFGSILLSSLPTLEALADATDIAPNHKYALSNAGWIDFHPEQGGGVKVCSDHLEGLAWGASIGWIKLGSHTSAGNNCDFHTYNNVNQTARRQAGASTG